MTLDHLTSIELWLNYPAGAVVETASIEDVACGMYACFYVVCDNRLKISTSVISLIREIGSFELDPEFQPDFVKYPWPSFTKCAWYRQGLTADRRVKRLRPFDTVTASGQKNGFSCDRTIKREGELIEKVISYVTRFINAIEKKFPDHQHIVLTGGKDSQLIHLIPKVHKHKWHVFSAEPNTRLVKEWLEKNGIGFGRFFSHDNVNDESETDLINKLVHSDCISEPDHMKWFKKCRDIAEEFSRKCIFWTGNYGEIHSPRTYHIDLIRRNYEDWAWWRGPTHGIFQKTGFQITGCLFLSAYFSKEIWADVYPHIDYSMFRGTCDCREKIGNRLAKRRLFWLKENPGPEPWTLGQKMREKYLDLYIGEIKKVIC